MISFQRTTPESVGIPTQSIIACINALKELDCLNSFMIIRHGKCCAEAWWKPHQPDTFHVLYSLSKSFTSIAVGIAQGEGKLRISDTLTSYFPEYEACITDDKMRSVTLKDLLTMSCGHTICPSGEIWSSAPGGDWPKAFLSSQLKYQPGTKFVYNSAGTYMLSAVVQRATGQTVRDYLTERLFTPLGITPGPWETCPQGVNRGGWGFHLRTEDLARFGQVILQGGKHNGQQLIPADYLAEATCFQIDNSDGFDIDWRQGYGYQFWQSQHGFRGDGACGQLLLVLKEQDMVIAVNSSGGHMQLEMNAFWDNIIPAVSDVPLPENPQAQAKLQELKATLSMPICQGNTSKRVPACKITFPNNEEGVLSADLSFEDDTCSLLIHTLKGDETLIAGFGHFEFGTLQLCDEYKRRTVASAAWEGDTLNIEVFCPDNAFREYLHIDFSSGEPKFTVLSMLNVFRRPFFPACVLLPFE